MNRENRIVKLKLDVIFKSMFGREANKDVIASFLASMLEIPRESIQEIIMDNVELIPDNFANKFSRVDLKMQVDRRIVNIEMQVCKEEDFSERTLYYWSKIYSNELKSGQNYGDLKETICINIMNFNLFECESFHSHFKVMEKTRHEVLSEKFGIHFFELKKIGKKPNKDNLMELWLQLINAETEEELAMLEQTNVKEIKDAIFILREISADEKMRYIADMREKALHDEVSAISSAEKRGIEKGIVKGKAEGIKEGIAEGQKIIIEKLRRKGMSEEEIKAFLED